MKILFIGDIVAGVSRKAIIEKLPTIKNEFSIDFCIANAENLAGGAGITKAVLKEFPHGLIDVFTAGDHVWDQKKFQNEVNEIENFLRPANLKSSQPGKGWNIFHTGTTKIAVINLIGRVFMKDNFAECPFENAELILKKIPEDTKIIIVDFHAEATSEKAALARYLDGKISALIGTHTHVQTNDAQILPYGTAFITDVGMTGPNNSILGREINDVITKFISGMPTRLEVAKGEIRFDSVIIDIDENSGKAINIKNISKILN
ncbi:MAG TPA: TIGR00282 family metallophosphoesterase [Victivallales bacterium]|nr:TIGR00282 family metallophosphoesterase [Victivallales bacterium]HRR06441.1 TIGR00282 family metallophosphoesterase [Victivallales bacterium]HRR28639.1 TIGR00282 family metallophosphoesterase [Victivallales bacterium]HRU01156.1 TIGR00282 family metallophosphoesterase [Victivallales bacterium]